MAAKSPLVSIRFNLTVNLKVDCFQLEYSLIGKRCFAPLLFSNKSDINPYKPSVP